MQKISIGKLKKLHYTAEEEYKSLRTNLQLCGKEVKVIGFTSCIPNEGKSSIVINIARTIAQGGKKVLIIDADMRKSVLVGRHRITKVMGGLSNLLSGFMELDEVICQTNVPNMFMVLAGPVPPNPSELLSSNVFKSFVKAASKEFDYVLIDCPPIGSVTDAAIVSQVCNGMCMVLTANEISSKFAVHIKEEIEKTGCRILGVILNKVKVTRNGYYGKYYGHYYGNRDDAGDGR